MEFRQTDLGVEVYDLDELDLDKTFSCGQCFRWDKVSENVFSGIALDENLVIVKEKDKLLFKDVNASDFESKWRKYFDLDTDYLKIKNELSMLHPILNEAATYSKGIRILKQDEWETLCSFIISQNNNIPRIKGIISRLCENFGEKIKDGVYCFPSPERIAQLKEKDLDILRAGFRSGYILDAAYKVSTDEVNLKTINKLDLSEAEKSLMKIRGVGPKVAQCTLLYGFHMFRAFPVDVWMKKAMKVLFRGKDPDFFGEYAGIAQQYIFHYSRMHKDLFEE